MPTQAEIDNAIRAMDVRRNNFGKWPGDPTLMSTEMPGPPPPEPLPPLPTYVAPVAPPVAPPAAPPAPAAPAAPIGAIGPSISPGGPIVSKLQTTAPATTGDKLASTLLPPPASIWSNPIKTSAATSAGSINLNK